MTADLFDPWSRVDPDRYDPPSATVTDPTEAAQRSKRFKRLRRIADSIGVLFWAYAMCKIFVFDIEAVALAPVHLEWLGRYRVAVFLVALSVVFVTFKRSAFWMSAYIAFLPLIYAVWKVPAFMYRHRSWTAYINVLNVATAVFHPYRYRLATTAVLMCAFLVSVASKTSWLLYAATAAYTCILACLIGRTLYSAVTVSKFLKFQNKIIGGLLDARIARDLIMLDGALKDESIEKYSSEQLTQFTAKVATGVATSRFVRYWAHQLDQYRNGPSIAALSIATYVWTFLSTLTILAMMNWTLLQADPPQFQVQGRAGFLEMLHYSLSSLALNGVEGITPIATIALCIKIGAGLLGPTILATLALHLFVATKSPRHEQYVKQAAHEARRLGDHLDEELKAEYKVTAEEAAQRIAAYAYNAILVWSASLISQIPEADHPSQPYP